MMRLLGNRLLWQLLGKVFGRDKTRHARKAHRTINTIRRFTR